MTGTIGIGHNALTALGAGSGNVAVGYSALSQHTTGSRNIAIGYGSMDGTAGDADLAPASTDNVAIGYDALGGNWSDNRISGFNVAIGNYALDGNLNEVINNVAIGHNSLTACVGAGTDWDGSNNVAVGFNSGNTITTGYYNTCVGSGAVPSAAAGVNQTVIGRTATGQAHNSVVLGNADVTAVYMNQDSGATVHCGQVDVENTAVTMIADTDYIGIYNNNTVTAGDSDTGNNIHGVRNNLNFNDTGESYADLTGIHNYVVSTETADEESNTIYGIRNTAQILGTHSDVANIYGILNKVDADAGTVDANVYGQYIDVDIESASSGIVDAYGMYVNIDADQDPSQKATGIHVQYATNVDFGYLQYDANNSTVRARIQNDGQIDSEGTINASQSLDYAEYFESKDGKVIANGTSVKLDGNKIVACSDSDTPLGVIRPKASSCIVGGGQLFHWEGMFMKDDYGADVWESYTLTKWSEEITFEEYSKRGKDETGGAMSGRITDSEVKGSDAIEAQDAVLDEDGKELEPAVEAVAAVPDKYYREHKYHSDRLPDGVTAPDDAETISPVKKRQKLNPDYDASKTYKSREERDEWHIVGLLGQIPITKGQPTGSWIKMKDVSDTVEMYFVK